MRFIIAFILALASPSFEPDERWLAAILNKEFGDVSTFYLNGDAASDGTGTEASPFKELSSLAVAINASDKTNDTYYIAGTVLSAPAEAHGLEVNGLSGCAFQQWPGMPQAIIAGYSAPITAWTEAVAGQRYTKAITVGAATVVSVIENWLTETMEVNDWTQHAGHLIQVASTAAVESTAGSWFYSGGTLHIHPSDSQNPNGSGNEYRWCRSGNGLKITNSTNVLWDDIHFHCWCDPASSNGYSIYAGTATNCTMRDLVCIDSGFHAFGFVDTSNTGNSFQRCVAGGCRSNMPMFVTFTSSGALTGLTMIDCTAHLYALMKPGLIPLTGTNGGNIGAGFITHTSGGVDIVDLRVQNYTTYAYDGHIGFAVDVNDDTATPSDLDDPATYPVRFVDCDMRGSGWRFTNTNAARMVAVAFQRCRIDGRNFTLDIPATFRAFESVIGNPVRLIFEACEFPFNLDGNSSNGLFMFRDNLHVRLFGCSLYDLGNDTGGATNRKWFDHTFSGSALGSPDTCLLKAQRCIFASRQSTVGLRQLCELDGGTPATNKDFDNNIYFNISTGEYSAMAAHNTQAEWLATIDLTGVVTNPGYTDPNNGDLSALSGGYIDLNQIADGLSYIGINHRANDNTYGAHQYGALQIPVGSGLRSRPRRGRLRRWRHRHVSAPA